MFVFTFLSDNCLFLFLELDAYANMVSVLRAQGPYTVDKKKLLQELASVLHISNERHRAEIRRAVNDDKLSAIAEQYVFANLCLIFSHCFRCSLYLYINTV